MFFKRMILAFLAGLVAMPPVMAQDNLSYSARPEIPDARRLEVTVTREIANPPEIGAAARIEIEASRPVVSRPDIPKPVTQGITVTRSIAPKPEIGDPVAVSIDVSREAPERPDIGTAKHVVVTVTRDIGTRPVIPKPVDVDVVAVGADAVSPDVLDDLKTALEDCDMERAGEVLKILAGAPPKFLEQYEDPIRQAKVQFGHLKDLAAALSAFRSGDLKVADKYPIPEGALACIQKSGEELKQRLGELSDVLKEGREAVGTCRAPDLTKAADRIVSFQYAETFEETRQLAAQIKDLSSLHERFNTASTFYQAGQLERASKGVGQLLNDFEMLSWGQTCPALETDVSALKKKVDVLKRVDTRADRFIKNCNLKQIAALKTRLEGKKHLVARSLYDRLAAAEKSCKPKKIHPCFNPKIPFRQEVLEYAQFWGGGQTSLFKKGKFICRSGGYDLLDGGSKKRYDCQVEDKNFVNCQLKHDWAVDKVENRGGGSKKYIFNGGKNSIVVNPLK